MRPSMQQAPPDQHQNAIDYRDQLDCYGFEVVENDSSILLANRTPAKNRNSLPHWTDAYGSLASYTSSISPTSFCGETNLIIGSWTAKGGYVHVADSLLAIEELARLSLRPKETITGIEELLVREPIVSNLSLSVRRPWEADEQHSVGSNNSEALSGSFMTSFGIPILFTGRLNSQALTRKSTCNPFARRLTRGAVLENGKVDGQFRYTLEGNSQIDTSFLVAPGMLAATLIDCFNVGMHLFRSAQFPESPAVLMNSLHNVDLHKAAAILREPSVVQMLISQTSNGDSGYHHFNAMFDITNSKESSLCSAISSFVIPAHPSKYEKIVQRSARRRNMLVTDEREAIAKPLVENNVPDFFLKGESASHSVLLANAFNLHSRAFYKNPYQFYDAMRSEAPALWLNRSDQCITPRWFATSYALCEAILKDKESFGRLPGKESSNSNGCPHWKPSSFNDVRRHFMLFLGPPKHTEVRQVFNQFFSSDSLAGLQAGIAKTAENLLASAQQVESFDLIQDYAEPMALTTLGVLMGLEPDDIAELQPLCVHLTQANGLTVDGADIQRANSVAPNLIERMQERMYSAPQGSVLFHVAELCRSPSALSAHLSTQDVLANALFLLVAGYQTTVNLIGNTAFALMRSPDQQAMLRSDSTLVKKAADEGARFDSSVQIVVRTALKDVVNFHGASFRKGEKISVVIGAANRDPAIFESPHTFNLTRTNLNKSLGYGAGIHTCIGTKLARLEATIALESLFANTSLRLHATLQPQHRPDPTLRGFTRLPVTFA